MVPQKVLKDGDTQYKTHGKSMELKTQIIHRY